ncbi:3-dehydroquinate synthase [Marinicrinis sediminis]|uniref:3-dehydroquinate synthase n=1 Tax=Marinicrinis sediminis TaxID=1652465 RepID=A0ABW5RCX7_9BACL
MRELWIELGERSYPIIIGDGLLNRLPQALSDRGMGTDGDLFIITDENIAPHYLSGLEAALKEQGYTVNSFVVPGGESSKSLKWYENIMTEAIQLGLDRKSVVIALGGGVVGDLAGFVAATYMRGVRFVQVPTTILAHDSSVGGKVAVNHPLAKNMIGAFHQPELVLYDTATLLTLSDREIRSGLAEVIKHGLIWDEAFLNWCDEHADALLKLDAESLSYALYRGCEVKASVVSQDEKEAGLRAILNLGHTIGHALEAVAGYGELLHGEAISIGMVGSARLAEELGYPATIVERTQSILERYGLPVRIPKHLDTDAIMAAMMRDKKFKSGQMNFVVPVEIGKVEIQTGISPTLVRSIVDDLKGEV